MTKTVIPMLAIWAAALGSAGALAYTLNRPLQPVGNIDDLLPPAPAPMALAPTKSVAPAVEQTEIPPLVVHREARHVRVRRAAALPKQEPFRELSEMRCTAWQDLMQGAATQQVRRCD
jgi:hypothetical protein